MRFNLPEREVTDLLGILLVEDLLMFALRFVLELLVLSTGISDIWLLHSIRPSCQLKEFAKLLKVVLHVSNCHSRAVDRESSVAWAGVASAAFVSPFSA